MVILWWWLRAGHQAQREEREKRREREQATTRTGESTLKRDSTRERAK